MIKKISMLALAGLIVLPTVASASGGTSSDNLERRVEELSLQLDQLKAQLAKGSEPNTDLSDLQEAVSDLEDRSEAWDLSARFKFYGDFRARLDYFRGTGVFNTVYKSESLWTNRFRLNMRVKATDNVEFKARLAMYKAWGMQNTPQGLSAGYPIFDGNATRTPADSALRVDRAFVNWNNIGGAPIWFSIGRRPTSDGPPAQMRMGVDERMATPIAYMDWPFDGLSLGYAYRWGSEAMGTGRIRFCYGRGFEDGLETQDGISNSMDDTDFAGLSWDVMKKGNRFMNIQSFAVFDVFNYPAFESDFVNYGASFSPADGGFGPQMNLGDLLHSSVVYQDKIADVNFFAVGGWSRTDPNENGMYNDAAGMIAQGMMAQGVPQSQVSGALASMGITTPELSTHTNSENGYSVYVGSRYDINAIGLKVGIEYNYGSEYWLSMAPGHDDMFQNAKLATRGSVYEVYGIYDLPTGDTVSKYAKTFIRFGYQRYEFDYSGSSDWNLKPYDYGNASDLATMRALGMDPIETADQIYLTFEAFF